MIEIWTSRDRDSARLREILPIAEKDNIPILFKEKNVLDHFLPGVSHQGIAALTGEYHYSDLSELINISTSSDKHALLVATDHITDEGNLGAVIRTSVFFGVHGLIIPKDRSAGITRNVMKRSSGAYILLPILRAVNIGRTLDVLDKKGFWIIGAEGQGKETIFEFDWKRDLVLVMGSEGRGISSGIRSRCHQLVKIPAYGSMGALNVSVACGVILSEIIRQRNIK